MIDRAKTRALREQFFRQHDQIELWKTAIDIERHGDRSAVPWLIKALQDDNPHRRHAAARALGWIPKAGPRAAKALMGVLLLQDPSQPQPVREEAAESLAYLRYSPAIPVLISVLNEPDARIRFWAVFALGSIGQWQKYTGRRVPPTLIQALERMLPDDAVASPNWWSVGREALAMLGGLDAEYREKLDREIERIHPNPNATSQDRKWAEGYGLK